MLPPVSLPVPFAEVSPFDLVCPAGSLPALKAAVDNGANCVYLGRRDATNARNFAGLNFDEAAIRNGVVYAHARGCKVFMALNTYPQATKPEPFRKAMDQAVTLDVDAVILADPGLMAHAMRLSPQARHVPEVIAVFDAVRRGELDGAAAQARLLPLMREQPCNGYWFGEPGLDQVDANAGFEKEVALDSR